MSICLALLILVSSNSFRIILSYLSVTNFICRYWLLWWWFCLLDKMSVVFKVTDIFWIKAPFPGISACERLMWCSSTQLITQCLWEKQQALPEPCSVSDTRCHAKKVIESALLLRWRGLFSSWRCKKFGFPLCETTVEQIHWNSCWDDRKGEVSSVGSGDRTCSYCHLFTLLN